jgi:uncharacterized protein (TIGR02147 family)
MVDLYQYTDYRALLRDWFAQAKDESPVMSYRYLARRLEIDPGFLAHIFQGNKHMAEKQIAPLAKIMGLGRSEKAYFERLVLFGKARSETEIARRFRELMEMRETRIREVSSRQYQYYLHWYVPAIRCLIAAREFKGDFTALASVLRPAITVKEAKQAVELLEHLGMVRCGAEGIWETIDGHVSTGDAWTSHVIRDFQKQTIQLALNALDAIPKEEREISTLTFSIPKDEIASVQDMVREFRSKMARWAVSTETGDMVYQMNMQVFPLVHP